MGLIIAVISVISIIILFDLLFDYVQDKRNHEQSLVNLVDALQKESASYKHFVSLREEQVELLHKISDSQSGIISSLYSHIDQINNDIDELESEMNSSEFRDFSLQTTLRAMYIQFTLNPAMTLAAPVIVNMLESALHDHDNDWYLNLQSAVDNMIASGETSEVSEIYKRCALDLSLIRPEKENALPN